MQILMSPTREKYPLSPRKPVKKTVSSMIGWLVLFSVLIVPILIAVLGLDSARGESSMLGIWVTVGAFILLFLIFIVTYIYQKWYFALYFYDLTNDFIVIKKGVITPREINIPYERVQDVYVDQDILDRIFGLYDVHLSSATITSGFEAHIDGVEKEAADGLKTYLLTTINTKIRSNPAHGTTNTAK